ncbi:MAG: site-2 protease family protein [Deltaproteobacteria bacterium]|nr:site-2 protease family protein [Deltaproteobacteria bacterium]
MEPNVAMESPGPGRGELHAERPSERRWPVHLLLYLATFGTTRLAGGWSYALTLMTILTFHEAGHYFAARRYRIPSSLPYFVPFPFSVFGTMGAVIAMPARIPHRRALLDVGAAGPIAGFAIALPALILGTRLSQVASAPVVTGDLVFGDNLVVKLVGWLFGPANPHDDVLMLHPIGFAGYVGCLVTAFNLIPVGQLDGGHVLHAWLGRRPVRPLLDLATRLGEVASQGDPSASAAPAARLRHAAALGVARLARFAEVRSHAASASRWSARSWSWEPCRAGVGGSCGRCCWCCSASITLPPPRNGSVSTDHARGWRSPAR